MDTAINFCSACGAPVALRVPPGDSLPRYICDSCKAIHYCNPKLVVGALPEWENRVLLCRRAIEPRHGKWTLPAGFMENNESVAAAALRETVEESGAHIELGAIYTLDFAPGEETLELGLFREEEIPWDEIAFRTISMTLKHYFADRRAGRFGFHTGEITPYADAGTGPVAFGATR